MRIARSVLAVLFGVTVFIAVVRLTGALTGSLETNEPGMRSVVLSLVQTVVAAMVGGFTTARLAGSNEFPHTAALGLLMIGLSFFSMRQEGISRPGWYQITVAGCGPVSAMIGAALRMLTKGSRTAN